MYEGDISVFEPLTVLQVLPYTGAMEQFKTMTVDGDGRAFGHVELPAAGFEQPKTPYVTVFEKKDGFRGKQFFWYYRSI